MYKGYRYIDNDAHVLEPADLWEKYLEPRFQDRRPRSVVRWERADPDRMPMTLDTVSFHQETHVNGYNMPAFDTGFGAPGIFQMPGCSQVYEEYMQLGFNQETYRLVLDSLDAEVPRACWATRTWSPPPTLAIPKAKGYIHAIEDTLSLSGVSEESKRKVMWDNGARLYDLA